MIEQRENQLVLSFPTPEAARAFAQFLTTLTDLRGSGISEPPFEQLPVAESDQLSQTPTQASPEPGRSRHTVLTDERLEALSNQRQNGLTAHQRLVRAQTSLRDGTLPFKQLSTAPSASGQPSPRMKAAAEGGFADGSGDLPEAERRKRSRLRPAATTKPIA